MTCASSLEPRRECFKKVSDPRPVKEEAGIENDDQRDAGPRDDRKIDIIPGLFCWAVFIELAKVMGDYTDGDSDNCAGHVEDIGLLRENHSRQSHPGAPEIVYGAGFTAQ